MYINTSFFLNIATNKYIGEQAFCTSNTFFHQMTNKSAQVLTDTQTVNPVIESLDPETFEVTAKKHSTMWSTGQYKDS